MKVSIVIPNWNGADKLRKNLPHVFRVKGVNEVIIPDDASSDNSVEVLETEFPRVKVIKRARNGGFSSNVNTGVKASSGDLIFLLNNDAVPNENCLDSVLHHFKNPKVFAVGANTGGSWSWAKFDQGFFWHYVTKEIPKNAHETLWVSGGSGVFRKDLWNKLDGLDEIFNPFYEEDVDLGYRATKRGYINLWEPKFLVEHYKEPGVILTNFSKDVISHIAQRNQLLFIWKNIISEELISDHKKALFKRLTTQPKYWFVFISALQRLSGILSRRQIEKKCAKLTDVEILGII